ncbi:MAG: TCP-1/cpn60 chaperonin family protein [Parcubacteria group bacterium]|jgi:chaperonin GroEL
MKILFDEDAREKIKKGINTCCDVVKVSLGHNGKNVLISNGQVVDIINDGVTIAKFVDSKDETELAGIRLAQQCAAITDQNAGDGTTTTLVLLQSFLREFEGRIEQPRTLRKMVLDSVDKVIEKLEKSAKKVEQKDIENIATTSSLSSDIGNMVAEIFKKLGTDAKITTDETRYNVLESKVIEGYQFDSENANLYQENKEVFENCPVLVCDDKATHANVFPHIQALHKVNETSLVVISKSISKDLIGLATKYNANGQFRVGLVKNKEVNEEDLKAIGNKVKKVIITKENTTLIGGNGDLKSYIKKLKEKYDKEESTFQKELLENRIAKLSSGVAVITVGAPTDVEREEKKLKVEDAINATKTSLKYGYVKGGGIALKEAGKGEFIESICNSIYDQICDNSEESIKVGESVKDSLLTVKESLRSAASIATSLLTAEAALIEENED